MQPPTSQNYDYTSSGIDNFLSRSIDQVTWQSSLESSVSYPNGTLTNYPSDPTNNAVRFDSNQLSGNQTGDYNVTGVTISN